MPIHAFCGILFYQMCFVRPKIGALKSPATYTCSRVLSTNIKNFFVQYPYHAVIGGNLKAIPNSPFLNCKWPNSNPLYGLDEVTLCVRYVLKSLYSIIEQPISNVLPCN